MSRRFITGDLSPEIVHLNRTVYVPLTGKKISLTVKTALYIIAPLQGKFGGRSFICRGPRVCQVTPRKLTFGTSHTRRIFMKYRKHEAKEYARTVLKGVWTALPYNFTADDRLDEKGIAFNLEHSISQLKIAGHYCSGNVAEFWSLTNEERMRAHEINVETAKGRIPLIAGCHHQNPYEAVKLAKHAQDIGMDFVIILTPYIAVRCDDAVYEYYRFVAERVDIGIVLFNIPQTYYPISEHLARRLATIPNICGFKQAGPAPAATISLREAVGDILVVSVADETPWLHNLSVMGDRWLLNYCPHLYQVPGYLPVHDYTRAALEGDMVRATEIARAVNPLRALHAKWITGYGRPTGHVPAAEMKYWMELIGMVGGPVRAPCYEMTGEARKQLRADLEATGLPAKAAAGGAKRPG